MSYSGLVFLDTNGLAIGLQKIPEDGFSAKPLCDGNVPGTTQLDEPFLYQSNYATHNSKANHHCKGSKYKQTTNIF